MNRDILTLEEFRKQELRFLPNATGELSNLLRDIALAAKRVNVEVNRAGLTDILGNTGKTNTHGETVQTLDEFANNTFINVLRRGISCAGIASEELEDFEIFDEPLCNRSKYIVVIDPLDGSSNIESNISIGTIFGIYRRLSEPGKACELKDFLQPGSRQVAAGYIIYGSSTMLVYATRRGVNGFTLDPSIGEFTLSHANIQCSPDGLTYSINYGNCSGYAQSVMAFIRSCEKSAESGSAFSLRYTGSMVADMHRNLLKGGIFLYPSTAAHPNGKLRLVYECNPFAFMYEMAGGKATDGAHPILGIQPVSLHQRIPFFAGSMNLMKTWVRENET